MPTPARPKTERRRKATTAAIVPDVAHDSPRVSQDDIARRAFAYYCERGGQHGSDLEDWLRAERELLETSGAPRRATAR